ncbi:MAG: hypothetical protein ABI661_06525 [Gammaproteobacteria bacterium]
MARPPRFSDALAVLARHQVDLVIVGGVAAVLNGAPLATFDLDIVHERSPENIDRLLAALADLDARYRDPGGRDLRPEAISLAGDGHHLLLTSCGPVDVLGKVGRESHYEDLLRDSVSMPIGGASVRVLGLAALIRSKEEADREKDRAVLNVLRETLRERQGS